MFDIKVRGLAHTERIPMCGSEKDRDRDRERERDRERSERDRDNTNPSGGVPCFSPATGMSLFPPPPPPRPTNMSPHYEGPLRLPQLPHMPHISFTDPLDRHCSSPLPRRKQVRLKL